MQKIIYLFLAILCSGAVSAQTFHVSGFAKDNNGALPYVVASLLNAKDSSQVQSMQTDEKGEFSFKDIKQGNYLISIQATGYKAIQPLSVDKSIRGLVVMANKPSKELKEVTVTDKKPYIETGLGKTVINVDQSATSAGSSVLDLLRKTPGVNVDGNGNVSLKGAGALILVDDKQTYMSGDQLADYLKSLPAEQVTQLELMTQPSSKYDAEGDGIINIKMKKMKRKGINGSAGVAYGQGMYPNTHDNLNLNYRNNKLNAYTNAAFLHATGFLNQQTERNYVDPATGVQTSHNTQNSFFKETFEDYSLKLGADYTASEKLTWGGSVNGIYHPNNESDVTRSVVTDNINNRVTYNNTTNDHGFVRDQFTGNAYLKYSPAKDHEINVNADYITRTSTERQDINSQNYDEQFQHIPADLVLQSKMPAAIDVFAVKADYSGALPRGMQLEAGVKTSIAKTDDDAVYNVLQNGAYVYDTVRSSHFIYNENINAVYANLSKAFGKKWQAQLGLRVENTNTKGMQLVHDQQFEQGYTGLFPTGYVVYKASDKNSFQCSFGRRIIRPGYKELDPFISYISQYSYSGGNPNLQPAYRNYFELEHNYNNMLFSSAGIRKIGNTVNPVFIYDAVTKAVYSTSVNNADRWIIELSTVLNKQLMEWWIFSPSTSVYINEYTTHNGSEVLTTSLAADVDLRNEFVFNGWTIDSSLHWGTGGLQNLTERNGRNNYISFSIAKKLFKDTATLKLSAEDPFDTYRFHLSKEWAGVTSNSTMAYAAQMYTLGFTYNFGKKLDNTRQRDHAVEEAARM